MTWTAWQYRDVYDSAYAGADNDTQDVMTRRLDYLLEHGNMTQRPISAPLRDGILEFRAKKVRILFFFSPDKRIIFVVGIVKDQRTVPDAAIEQAIKIRQQIEGGIEVPIAVN